MSWDVLEVASVPSGEGTLRPSYVSWDVLEVATVPSGVGILQGPSRLLTLANQHHPNSCNRPNSQHCPNSTWGQLPSARPNLLVSHPFGTVTTFKPERPNSRLWHHPNLTVVTVPTCTSQLHLGRSQLPTHHVPTLTGVPSTWDGRNFQARMSQLLALASQLSSQL